METGSNVCLKCVRSRLAVVLRPGPLGELKRSPRPSSRNKGPTSKGKGEKRREGREGKVGRGRKGIEGRKGRERKGERGEKGRGGKEGEGKGRKGFPRFEKIMVTALEHND